MSLKEKLRDQLVSYRAMLEESGTPSAEDVQADLSRGEIHRWGVVLSAQRTRPRPRSAAESASESASASASGDMIASHRGSAAAAAPPIRRPIGAAGRGMCSRSRLSEDAQRLRIEDIDDDLRIFLQQKVGPRIVIIMAMLFDVLVDSYFLKTMHIFSNNNKNAHIFQKTNRKESKKRVQVLASANFEGSHSKTASNGMRF